MIKQTELALKSLDKVTKLCNSNGDLVLKQKSVWNKNIVIKGECIDIIRQALKRGSWADGYKKAQDTISRRNKSGCCCKFAEDEETIISMCEAHKALLKPEKPCRGRCWMEEQGEEHCEDY